MRWLVLGARNMYSKYEVSIFNRSKDIEWVHKFPYWNADFVPMTVEPVEPKSVAFDTMSRTTIAQSFESFRSGVFVLSC